MLPLHGKGRRFESGPAHHASFRAEYAEAESGRHILKKDISATTPTHYRFGLMRREASGIMGLIGGLVDLWAGSSILLQTSMAMSPMGNGSATLWGYFLIAVGIIVLLTGAIVLVSKVMSRFIGPLMIVYGLVMLVLGAGMIGGFLNIMMRESWLSGIVMLVLGFAMLYSGSKMTRRM